MVFPEAVPTAQAAAARLGVTTTQIVNSLIFEIKISKKEREGVLVCAPGDRRIDRAKLATALGVSKAKVKSASAEAVLRYTGYEPGGVGPCGFLGPLRATFVEDRCFEPLPQEEAEEEPVGKEEKVLWCGGGVKPAMFRCSPQELLQLSAGQRADLAEE